MFGEDLVNMPRARLPGFRRRIGVVFQDFRLVPHLTAFDNIALPLRIAGISERDLEGPVNEMLAWIGLTERADARPATLSGGEQQRVILARALTQGSECLVLDEPTNHLDIKYQLEIMDIVKSLNHTVIAAIHDLNIACMYCDRLIAIRKGEVVGMGTPRELLTADFIKNLYDVDCEVHYGDKGRMNIVYIPRHWKIEGEEELKV